MSELEKVGDGLEGVLRRIGLPPPDAASRIMEEWDALAGEMWAARARPAGLRDGVLRVVVDDGATATLLRYRSAELIERLGAFVGPGVVTGVRVTVGERRRGP